MEYIPAKALVSRTKNTSWFGTEYNMNIYRGCNHGCIYCDSRSNCYGIEDFSRVRAKKDALLLLERDLKGKRKKGVIATGSMSDPYNPFEKSLHLTENALALIDRYKFGVAIATKSDLVTRDLKALQNISAHSPAIVKITITTISDEKSKIVEPGAPLSSARFDAIHRLSQNGIFAGILMMPVLPFIEDDEKEIEAFVERAKEAGAKFIYPYFGMTLREGQREYFYQKLEDAFPGLSKRYKELYQDRYNCDCPDAGRKYHILENACEKRGILFRMKEIIAAYQAPYQDKQLDMFSLLE